LTINHNVSDHRDKVERPPGELGVSKSMECDIFPLQCFDAVGWAAGDWFVGGDDLTGALHDL